MPRTAPAVTGSVVRLQISMQFIDDTGDKRSIALNTTNTSVTDAQIDAMVDAVAAASQANLYGVSVERLYITNADIDDALNGPHDSVYDGYVILFKNLAQINGSVSFFLPAPLPALWLVGDRPNTDSVLIEAVTDAVETVLGSGWDDASARLTERREKNESTPL